MIFVVFTKDDNNVKLSNNLQGDVVMIILKMIFVVLTFKFEYHNKVMLKK